MRGIRLFPKKVDYDAHVFEEILRDRELRDHPFYRNLTQFVLDAKAPIFYKQSDPTEHANFSAYYNFVLMRDTYTNVTLESMYFLHDFTHMLFYYPHDVSSVTQDEFNEAVIQSEYAASNETEILLHYRAPAVRSRVFQDRRIFFDILREKGVAQPSVRSLGWLRKLLIETDVLDPYFFIKPEDEPVKATFKSYQGNNIWCKRRLADVLRLPNPTEYHYRFLTQTNYERVLSNYTSSARQEDYEQTILMNVRLAFALIGLQETPPRSFAEALEKVRLLEGRPLLRSVEDEGHTC